MARYYGPTLVCEYADGKGSISHPVSTKTLAEVVGRLHAVVMAQREPTWSLHLPEDQHPARWLIAMSRAGLSMPIVGGLTPQPAAPKVDA